jgi:DNA-directed RNA polymerase specialized sigma24 family protein
MRTGATEGFTPFVENAGARLRRAFIAMYGPEVGSEVTADALAYAWEHWERLQQMDNPAGYLFRVGQSRARGYRHRPRTLPSAPETAAPWFEPKLPAALSRLSEKQRIAVLLCEGFGWTRQEVADLMEVNPSTVQRHIDRGMAKVRKVMGVGDDA